MGFSNDFKKATMAFLKNREVIESAFNGELYSLELEKNQLNDLFDKSASTDILLKANGLVYGVAMRVNFSKYWHSHITIRHTRKNGHKTEFEKTMLAIKHHSINSCIGIQIDVDDDLQIIRGITYDRYCLFKYIYDNLNEFKAKYMHTVKSDGNTMFYITYDLINELQIKNKIFYETTTLV